MSTVTQVEYRQLGKSGLKVSVPIIGGGIFGSKEHFPIAIEAEDAFILLKAAWDKGINTIDTANMYCNGASEEIVGQFVKKFNIPRNEIIIATKCFWTVGKAPGIMTFLDPDIMKKRDYVNQGGLSRAAILNQVEASLARLKTSYIDLYQIHRYDPATPAEETMKALHDLVQAGKVRYIGASSMRAWQFAHLNEVARENGWTTFVSMQDEYSLLYREEEREMLPYCAFHGIGVIPWSPLAGGALARPLDSSATERMKLSKDTPMENKLRAVDEIIIKRVEELAEKHGVNMSQIALAWIGPKVVSPIVGVSSVQRLEQSLSDGITLTEDEVSYLESPYVPQPIRSHA